VATFSERSENFGSKVFTTLVNFVKKMNRQEYKDYIEMKYRAGNIDNLQPYLRSGTVQSQALEPTESKTYTRPASTPSDTKDQKTLVKCSSEKDSPITMEEQTKTNVVFCDRCGTYSPNGPIECQGWCKSK